MCLFHLSSGLVELIDLAAQPKITYTLGACSVHLSCRVIINQPIYCQENKILFKLSVRQESRVHNLGSCCTAVSCFQYLRSNVRSTPILQFFSISNRNFDYICESRTMMYNNFFSILRAWGTSPLYKYGAASILFRGLSSEHQAVKNGIHQVLVGLKSQKKDWKMAGNPATSTHQVDCLSCPSIRRCTLSMSVSTSQFL